MKFTDCCLPRQAPSPSGVTYFHSRFCDVGHGAQIDAEDHEKASAYLRGVEARKRAEKLARDSGHPVYEPPVAEYNAYWSDLAYEQQEGK